MDPMRDSAGRGYHFARRGCIEQGVGHMMALNPAAMARRNVAALPPFDVATEPTWDNSQQKEHSIVHILAGIADACRS